MKFNGSWLSAQQSKKTALFFIAGTTARIAAELMNLNRNTVNLFYKKLRLVILINKEKEL